MVSLGFSSLQARRRSRPLAAVRVPSQSHDDDALDRRHTPVVEDLDEDARMLDLKDEEVEETDDEDDDGSLITSSLSAATATDFPTTLLPETTTTLPIPPLTISSSYTSSAISTQMTSARQTVVPAQTRSFSTGTTSSVTAVAEQQSQEPGGHQNDNGNPGGCGKHVLPGLSSTDTKVAVAFGTIGAIGLIVALIWAAILIRRRRRRHGLDEANPHDYPSRIGRRRRFNFDFNFKIPSITPLPFSFASPLHRFQQPDPNAIRRRQASSPSTSVSASNHMKVRAESSVRNETNQTASRMSDSDTDAVPQGWLDEKRHDPRYPLPVLTPEPVQQASIRKSVASWFRRSSKHHPLQLNPMRQKSSLTSMTSALSGGDRSRPGSLAPTSRTTTRYSSSSRESWVAEGTGSGDRIIEEIPPLPDLGSQRIMVYTKDTTPTLASSAGESANVAAPLPAFTKEDARAYYRSMWAESSAAGTTERLSAMSSWTDLTTRTSMQAGSGNRESVEQAGLSPPPGHANMNRTTQTLSRPLTATTGVINVSGGMVTETGERG